MTDTGPPADKVEQAAERLSGLTEEQKKRAAEALAWALGVLLGSPGGKPDFLDD